MSAPQAGLPGRIRVDPDTVASYTAAGWWDDRTVGALVGELAVATADAPAIITPTRRASWLDYDRLADRLGAVLCGAGLVVGDKVAVRLPDGLAIHAALVAAQRCGVIAVGIGWRAGDAEIAHLLRRTGARILIGAGGHSGRARDDLLADLRRHGATLELMIEVDEFDRIEAFDAAAAPASPVDIEPVDTDLVRARALDAHELSMLNSTSGTTGLPKCVMQFESRWFHFADLAADAGRLTADEVFFGAVPAPFGFGLWTSHFAPAAVGVPTVVLPRFSARDMIQAIEREKVTVLCCVSTQFRMLLNSPEALEHDLSSLRVMFTGGETVPFEQAADFERRTGATALQFFGSNETGAFSYTTLDDPAEVRLKTAGRLIEHMDVRLYDDDGSDITGAGRPGQPGGTGPLTCLGYYDDAEANSALHAPDGAMLMGDLVSVTGDVLTVVGRKADIVIRGGKNISAAQVEAEVGTHPAVDLVAVVPVPDDVFGERVCAVVTLRGSAVVTLADIGAHLSARGVSRESHPEHLVVRDELPRASGGKLAKSEIRRLAVDAVGLPTASAVTASAVSP